MSPTRAAHRRLRERGILVLGLGSAFALVAAAFAPATAPDVAGRAALARLAAQTGDTVWATWNRLRRAPEPLGPPASPLFDLSEAPGRVHPGPADAASPGTSAPGPGDRAGAALLGEARRLEAAGDLAGARDAVDAALARAESPAARLRARLRKLELSEPATRARAVPEVARDALADARSLAAPEDLALAVRALAAVASAPWDAEFEREAHALLARWCAPDVRPLDAELERIDGARPYFALRVDATANALAEHLSRARPADATWLALRSEREQREALAALVSVLGKAPARGESDVWQLVPVRDAWFTARSAGDGSWTGCFVARADLAERFQAALAEAAALPDGVAADLRGDDEAFGTALGPRTALAGDELAFTLRHRDPESFVRETSRKQLVLRIALLVMAAFAAGAGVLMARALARERRLADLETNFIANVSHELRTPLASILLMAENLAAGRPADDAGRARYHALIRREALRLARLVDDVLDFSRLERGRFLELQREPVELAELVRTWSLETMEWAAQHALECSFGDERCTGTAVIDREALRRVLFNLLENARKHSGSSRVRLELAADGDSFGFSVADEGRGIPVEKRELVFEPFARLAEGPDAAPGTGLGLAIAREIVHAHGGTIVVKENNMGPGTRVDVRIPRGAEGART